MQLVLIFRHISIRPLHSHRQSQQFPDLFHYFYPNVNGMGIPIPFLSHSQQNCKKQRKRCISE